MKHKKETVFENVRKHIITDETNKYATLLNDKKV